MHDSGGPPEGKSLDSWRISLRQQLTPERDGRKADNPALSSSSTQGDKSGDPDGTPEPTSPSKREGDAVHVFQAQVAPFSGLSTVVGGSHATREQVKQLVDALSANSVSPGTEGVETDKLRELDRLVLMAKDLGDMAVSAALWT